MSISDPLALIAITCAAISTAILLWFLIRRPALGGATKVMLLLGLGVFPLGTAATGNVAGYQATKQRSFCGSCHVMKPWTRDSDDPTSTTLAASHARNPMFGDENCYTCHADYGKLGALTTKIGGMGHVYEYTIGGYSQLTEEEAVAEIHIRKSFPNSNCMQCHSTEAAGWRAQPDHAAAIDEVRAGTMSCMGAGCHGPAHPFSQGGTPR